MLQGKKLELKVKGKNHKDREIKNDKRNEKNTKKYKDTRKGNENLKSLHVKILFSSELKFIFVEIFNNKIKLKIVLIQNYTKIRIL